MNPSMKDAREKAKSEIYAALAADMRISAERLDKILAKHGVKRDPKALQRAYRLSVGQRIMAGVRDADGKREVLAARTADSMEYIVVEACSDPHMLKQLQRRLRGCISGLESTSGKIKERQNVLAGIRKRLFQRRRA